MIRLIVPLCFALASCATAALPLHAQPTASTDSLIVEGKKLIDEGVNRMEAGKLHQARALFERLIQHGEGRTALAHYYAAMASRRLTDITDDEEKALAYIDQSIDHLEKAVEVDDAFAEAYALLASQYGRKMAINPMYGMSLGPAAEKAMTQAQRLAPTSPRVVLLQAMSDYFTPKQWGGDKEKAMKEFRRSARLFDEERIDDPLRPDWGHEEAYTWLGIAYMEGGDYADAEEAFEQALEANPEFGWVQDVLLPQARAEQNQPDS